MIQLTNITKSYKNGKEQMSILNHVNLHIPFGEFVAVLGPSGSGKSTLLNILGLLDCPSSGMYTLDGKDTTTYSQARLATVRNRQIGFIFQQFMLIPRLTVQENVALPLLYTRSSRRDRKERVENALEQVGLLDKKRELPIKLSGGQKQRVAIARAIVSEPQILLADEPTGNLDVEAKQDVIGILENLHKSGKAIVLVTHDHDLARIADRILYVENRTLVSLNDCMARGERI